MIDDIFTAGGRELREVMMPRTEVSFLDAQTTIQSATLMVIDQPHSRYPVIRGSADDVIGFVHIRDILDPANQDSFMRVEQIARHVQVFPGSKGVMSTLNEMRRLRAHLAIVQDEYGGTAGLITMEDLVEELIGDIKDEYDAETPTLDIFAPGEITVDGLLNRDDFADETQIVLPEGPLRPLRAL